jgi:hypothetical protein
MSKKEQQLIEIYALLSLLIKEVATQRGLTILKLLNEKISNL